MVDVVERAQRLREAIDYYAYRYYELDDPAVTDAEYDALWRELVQIEADNPEIVTPDSPTQRVPGAAAGQFAKVRHPAVILSLGNVFSPAELVAWRDRTLKLLPSSVRDTMQYVVEPKIDGLTVVLHYEDGRIVLGATRGDGVEGEDITANLRTVRAVPLRIPARRNDDSGRRVRAPQRLVVRGEAYTPIADFERFNEAQKATGDRTYANPRNFAAGSLRQLDARITATRPIKLWVYQIIAYGDPGLAPPASQWQALQYLHDLGFPVSPSNRLFDDFGGVLEMCETWGQLERARLAYEADGLVVKLNPFAVHERLGSAGKDPRWAVAYKYPAEEAITRLLDIRVNVGRTGTLNPYAVLEPVPVGGVIVSTATLHNEDYVRDKDIRVGDVVAVKRAGEVIPQVLRPLTDLRTGDERIWRMPDRCPACGQLALRSPEEAAWYCINSACPAQLVRGVEHFVGRGAMDIEGFGIRQAELFVQLGYVRDLADVYYLDRQSLLDQEGYGERRVNNLMAAIEGSKTRPLPRLLTALGIKGVGEVVAELLTGYYASLDALATAPVEELQAVPGIGPVLAQSIIRWFAEEPNRRVIAKLKAAGVQTARAEAAQRAQAGNQPFNRLTFVVTGTLPSMSRESAKEFIRNFGGKVTDSVSKSTSFLVAGESAGSKLDRAQQIGVPVIDEAELRRMAGD